MRTGFDLTSWLAPATLSAGEKRGSHLPCGVRIWSGGRHVCFGGLQEALMMMCSLNLRPKCTVGCLSPRRRPHQLASRAPPLHSGKGGDLCLGQAFSTARREIGVPYNTEVFNVSKVAKFARAERYGAGRKSSYYIDYRRGFRIGGRWNGG